MWKREKVESTFSAHTFNNRKLKFSDSLPSSLYLLYAWTVDADRLLRPETVTTTCWKSSFFLIFEGLSSQKLGQQPCCLISFLAADVRRGDVWSKMCTPCQTRPKNGCSKSTRLTRTYWEQVALPPHLFTFIPTTFITPSMISPPALLQSLF